MTSATALTPASADGSGGAAELALADSATLTTPALVTGTVTKANGAPAARARVVLYAWPSNDVMERQQVGDAINLQPVATTIAGPDGSFALRLSSTDQLAPWADANNLVNLTATAVSGSRSSSWSFSRRLSAMAAPSGQRSLTATVSADSGTAAAEQVALKLGAAGATRIRPTRGAVAAASSGAMAKSCVTALISTYSPVWVIVGQNYSTTAYASANYQYYKDATSSLGVGTSATGKYGSFKASGTASRSSSSSVDFPTTKGAVSRYHLTKYQYALYQLTCIIPGGVPLQHYEVRPYKYVSGSQERTVDAVSAGYCATFAKGSKFTAEKTASITWTDGADMSAVVGIDFSAQTGYTTKARIQWAFTATRRLCGTADYPGEGTFRMLRARK
jgi:hypothetical protein